MNIASYLQERQYGFSTQKRKKFKEDQLGKFLDEKTTESLVNKACSISGTCRSTFIMEFSPDGTKVASTHGDHTVRITDIATGQCVRTLQGHPRTPWCLAYHPSSSHILASGCLGGQVRIWDLYGYGCEVWQSENSSVIASLTFHPTDHVLVIGTGNSLYFWDWSQPEPFTKSSTLHEYERIRWVKFDRLGHKLYTGISNNTVLNRDEVPNVSLTSQNPTPAPRQPSRLSNVYSRIINYYQEYRRERLAHETSTGLEPDTTRQPEVQETDPFPGVSDIDIVEPRSPSNTRSHDRRSGSTSTNQPSQVIGRYSQINQAPESRLTADILINPNNDPFLPVVSPASSTEPTRGFRLFSGQTVDTNTSISDPAVTESSNRHSVRQTDFTNVIQSAVIGRNEDVQLTDRNSVVRGEGITERSTSPANNMTNLRNMAPCSSTSVTSSSVMSSDNTFTSSSVTSRDNTLTNRLNDSVQALSESIRSSITSCSDINPYLARYLKTQASRKTTQTTTSTTTQPTKTFPSIRDRLKINIPLSLPSGANVGASKKLTGIPPVTILSDNKQSGRMTGVPPVTVLSGNRESRVPPVTILPECRMTAVPPVTVLSGNSKTRVPPVTVISGNNKTGVPPVSTLTNRRLTGITPVTILPSSNVTNPLQTNCDIIIPQGNVLYSHSSGPNHSTTASSNPYTTKTEKPETIETKYNPVSTSVNCLSANVNNNAASPENSIPTSCISAQSLVNVNSNLENNLNQSVTNILPRPIVTSQASPGAGASSNHVTSLKQPVSGRANLFENVQRARYQRRMRNSGERFQPYRLPTPHQPLSLMGPYLASRGLLGAQSGVLNNQTNSSTDRSPSDQISSQDSRGVGSDNGCVANVSANMSNSSVTNQSAHVSGSSTHYFLPITDNSREGRANLIPASVPTMNTGQNANDEMGNQSIELVVDQNENYTAVRDANNVQVYQSINEVQVGNNDSNNNSLHIVQQPETNVVVTSSSAETNVVVTSSSAETNVEVTSSSAETNVEVTSTRTDNQTDRDYIALRNTFVSMTDQIEREMSDLNRRINALRDSFNQSLFSLRQDRQRFESVGQGVDAVLSGDGERNDQTTGAEDRPSRRLPVIVTDDSQSDDNESEDIDTQGFMIQPPTLLETSLRSHRRGRQGRLLQRPMLEEAAEPQDWRQLQRHYLHPHYSSSIFDETINRPSNAIQSAINRAIAGAFMGTGESAVANNIINQTHRIQCWDFTRCYIPDITSCDENVVVLHCKLHNSASCDISPNGALLATFVPSHHGFPDDNILAVYSLLPDNIGQCLYTKSFGPNAISISISPSNNHILVGLAAKKLSWVFTARQMVAQIYKLDKQEAGEKSTKLVKDIFHMCSTDIRSQVSGNSARWLPLLGQGLIYGTNRGHLNFCKPGVKTPIRKIGSSELQNYELTEETPSETSRRFTLRRVPWLTHTDPHRVSASTQTPAASSSTATQTEVNSRETQI